MVEKFEELLYRISGDNASPPILYLPGVHGDWTSFHRSRELLAPHFRLIEIAYPREENLELSDLASRLMRLIDALGVGRVHLLAESFGSLLGWEIGLKSPQRVNSLILAAGFCGPLPQRRAKLAGGILRLLPSMLFELGVDTYVAFKDFTGEGRPPMSDAHPPFFALRTRSGRLATARRMQMIDKADYRDYISKIPFPVRYLGGEKDLIVPVQREEKFLADKLSRSCSFNTLLVPKGSHMILASHPRQSCLAILEWISQMEPNNS